MKDNLLGEYLITKDYTNWMVKTGGFARDKTLRDEFAGLAMQAFLTADVDFSNELMIYTAYSMADAMIKERAK
jgi:hypothetical protein